MNSPAADFKDYLLDYSETSEAEIDFLLGGNLFIGILPANSVGICHCLFDITGSDPEPNNIRVPCVQILTRGEANGYIAAWDEIETVANLFHELTNETIGATRYIQIRKLGDIAHVGNDEKGRPIFSCTMSALRTD